MSLYGQLLLASMAGPLLLSFDKKVAFFKTWKHLFPAILVSAFIFIAKDILFAKNGVWSFNPNYTGSLVWWGLPLEEWLFFLVIPYCCIFIYEVLNAYFPNNWLQAYAQKIALVLGALLIILGLAFLPRWYTGGYFLFTGVCLLIINRWQSPRFMANFLRAYLVSLLPFLLVNGVLTAMPVVEYNAQHILNWRISTIPVEDTVYCLSMLLIPSAIFEYLKTSAK